MNVLSHKAWDEPGIPFKFDEPNNDIANAGNCEHAIPGSSTIDQLKDCLNCSGDTLVFFLNSLLNDCGCSKPSW
jgi:hypothetical protein